MPVGNKGKVVVLNAIIEAKVFVELVNLFDVALAHFEFKNLGILLEVLLHAHAREHNMILAHMPVQDYLGLRLLILFSQVLNDGFLKEVEILDFLVLLRKEFRVLSRSNWRIGRNGNSQFAIELNGFFLSEVWMTLKTVDRRLLVAESENLEEHNDWAVHHTDASDKPFLSTVLHLAPHFLNRNSIDHE